MTKYTTTQIELETSEKISLRAAQIIKNLPNRLWQLRADVGISQIALGKELHISPNQISNYELGNNCPSPEALYSYSKFFGISMQEIVFGNNTDCPANMVSSTQERTYRFLLKVATIIYDCHKTKEDDIS